MPLRLNFLWLNNACLSGKPSLPQPAHQEAKEEERDQCREYEAGERAKDSRHFFPASRENKTQAQRHYDTQYLPADIPEQKALIRIQFQSGYDIDRATKRHDEKARDEDRPGGPAPEVGAASFHRLGSDKTETLFSFKPADERHANSPANKIAQVVSQHGCAQGNRKQDEEIEIVQGGKRTCSKEEQRTRNGSANGSGEDDQPENRVPVLL